MPECEKNYTIFLGGMPPFLGGICNKDCNDCTELALPAFGNTYTSINMVEPITDDALEFRSNLLYLKAFPKATTSKRTISNTVLLNDKSSIATLNPVCTDDFCSNHGKCMKITKYLTCFCDSGFSGTNCHINNNDHDFLKSEISK